MHKESENIIDNKRDSKEHNLLYVRMSFSMGVGQFTSRVIAASLRGIDYRVNNVVGGSVVMFGFLNTKMSTLTQCYLTHKLGCGNTENLSTSN